VATKCDAERQNAHPRRDMLTQKTQRTIVFGLVPAPSSIPGASTENPNDGWGFRLLCMWSGQGAP
jgi:hypothetical protein